MTSSAASETAAGRAGRTAARTRSDVRAARRSQVAGVGLVLVLLAVSVFAVVESQLTAAAAEEAGRKHGVRGLLAGGHGRGRAHRGIG